MKYFITFHAQADQIVDIEKPPVVDEVCRFPPVREPVMLPREEAINPASAEVLCARSDRQLLLVILKHRPSVLDPQHEFMILDCFAIWPAEDGQHDLFRLPIHIEELSV